MGWLSLKAGSVPPAPAQLLYKDGRGGVVYRIVQPSAVRVGAGAHAAIDVVEVMHSACEVLGRVYEKLSTVIAAARLTKLDCKLNRLPHPCPPHPPLPRTHMQATLELVHAVLTLSETVSKLDRRL